MALTRFGIAVVMGLALTCAVIAAEVSSPRHEVIAADKGKIVRYDAAGKPVWIYEHGSPVHHIQQLPNGNLLTQKNWTTLVEISPEKQIVWSYDAGKSNGNAGKKIEIHTFARLPNGNTAIVENGAGRVIEIDPAGTIQSQFPYQVSKPDAHRDVRQAQWLSSGNVLICHEGDGKVVEYSPQGEIVWSYDIPLFDQKPRGGHGVEAWGNQVFNALRLANGNTLIATGNGHSVLEVTPEKEIVWHLKQNDLPGITLAWVTSLEQLPNGNLIVGNCHAGPENPQLIEVSRDKKAVWTFKDFDLLGNSTAASATVAK
ncbi:beta-propeller domain-containing protein [Planctomicrobium piriforme]|uniref:PQQ-like domain-containing protein n=1 Tax=Planctomicrobium piriforme TaxID=1576369 RepID=A0A1I3JIB4_9PLAN|nr:PQQ-binding-like beta-propeller repeat protein [Planctomicrobium piriforme]SFI59989.1 PQQ-like domain-containing protein [Planctomicrobium piriforme]